MSSSPSGVSSRPRSSARSSAGITSIAPDGIPAYLKRSASSAARSPVAIRRPSPASSGSRATSQIQETSRPSAIASFNAITASDGTPTSTIVRTAPVADRPDSLVRPGGVLDQEHQQPPLADGDPLEAPERRGETPEAGGDLVQRRAERAGERRGGQRVVDVVEPGHPEAHVTHAVGRLEPERDRVEPV